MPELVLALGLIICLLTDLKERKIYNMVLIPLFIFGITFNIVYDGWNGLWHSVTGTFLGLGILVIPFARGGIGAGDVKLLAIIGAIKGPAFVLYTALGMGISGGIIALLVLLLKGSLLKMLGRFFRGVWLMLTSRFKVIEFGIDNEQYFIPYGVPIAIGVLGAYCVMG